MLFNMILPGAVEVVPPDENTLLLLHGEDLTDGSIYGHTVTNSGVTVSAAQSKFGGSSLYFNGSSSKLTINSDLFNFGSGDFTVDWWEYITATPATRFTFSYNNGWGGICAGGSGNTNILYVSSIEPWDMFQANAFSTTLNAWVHWAVVRSGNNFYTFRNGVKYWSGTGSGNIFWNGAGLVIGAFPYDSSHYFGGYIDEFRVSNIARWTEAFTPPTEPYEPGGSSGESGGTDGDFSFTYSGNYTDNRVNGKGTVRLNSSGVFEVLSGKATVSAYIQGAGGGAAIGALAGAVKSTGGGGGYQTVEVELAPGTYEIVIGVGGEAKSGSITPTGGTGGNTIAFGKTSTGGTGGTSGDTTTAGIGGTPNGGNGSVSASSVSNVSGGSPNGGGVVNGVAQNGGDGYVELTFI